MCDKSWKFFGRPTTKWLSCKLFAKLIGNHLWMDNIFKLQKYLTFDLMKMHDESKIWFVNNKSSLKRYNKKFDNKSLGLQLTGRRKCYFLIFVFFIFPNFEWLLSKILWKNHPSFKMNLDGSYESLLSHKYFWSLCFW